MRNEYRILDVDYVGNDGVSTLLLTNSKGNALTKIVYDNIDSVRVFSGISDFLNWKMTGKDTSEFIDVSEDRNMYTNFLESYNIDGCYINGIQTKP